MILKEKIYGVGVHGAGWVSGQHLDAYNNNSRTKVVAISSRKLSSCESRAKEAGLKDIKLYDDYEKMLENPEVDIISICTPQHLHANETILAAEARKHIYIEKPVCNTLEELKAMRDAVRKAKIKTIVSFVLRWNPLLIVIKEMLADEAVGEVYHVDASYQHNLDNWWSGWWWGRTKEFGVSSFLVGGCHAIDASRWFSSKERNKPANITEVYAHNGGLRKGKGRPNDFEYDAFEIMLTKYDNGVIGKVSVDFECIQPYTFPLVIFGDKGTIRNNRVWSEMKYKGQTDWIEIPTILPDSGDVTHHPFRDVVDHFINCIEKDIESHANLEDAVNTHEAAIAAMISEKEHRPVKLPLIK